MKYIFLIFCLLLLCTHSVNASAPVNPLWTNDAEQTCFWGRTITLECETGSLSEAWKIPHDYECPKNYRRIDNPDRVWKKIDSFETLAHAHKCDALFSKGSPVWMDSIKFTIGIVLGALLIFFVERRRKKIRGTHD